MAIVRCGGLVAALSMSACAALVHAAEPAYPSKPIRIIVQLSTGTSTDILARMIAQKLTDNWGQQVIVDNRPGAAGIVGTALGAKATPDGYTLTMMVSSAFSINPTLYSKLPYDPVKDFAPISSLAITPQTLVTTPSAPFKSLKDFVAAAKDRPGQINFASLGSGATSHLSMEMLRSAAEIKLNHVPFKAGAEAHAQVISGEIPVMFDAIPATMPHIKSGKLRGLGIASLKRSPFLPELPTMVESGYPDFQAVGWTGIAAPVKTPAAILDKLNAEMLKIIKQPDMKERMSTFAFTPVNDSREGCAAYLKSEIARWGKAIRDSGAKAD